MRVLVVHPGPSWATFDVYRGWLRGLTHAGCDVRPFNLDDRLRAYSTAHFVDEETGEAHRMWPDGADVARLAGHGLHAACYQFQPDVVLVVSARLLPAYVYDIIRERGSKVVLLFTESPYEDVSWQLDCAPHADVCLVNDPTNIDTWREACPTLYVPHAYDPQVHRPGPSRYAVDVAWIGTAGDTFPSRTRFLEQVDFGDARVFLGGLWAGVDESSPLRPHIAKAECVDNDETAEVYRGAKMSFNLYRAAGDHTDAGFVGGWAMGPREVELAATGCFFARHSPEGHGGEGDEVLPMLPRFTEPGELTEIIRFYLARDDMRRDLSEQARAAVADRTFEHHAERLLRQLDAVS